MKRTVGWNQYKISLAVLAANQFLAHFQQKLLMLLCLKCLQKGMQINDNNRLCVNACEWHLDYCDFVSTVCKTSYFDCPFILMPLYCYVSGCFCCKHLQFCTVINRVANLHAWCEIMQHCPWPFKTLLLPLFDCATYQNIQNHPLPLYICEPLSDLVRLDIFTPRMFCKCKPYMLDFGQGNFL